MGRLVYGMVRPVLTARVARSRLRLIRFRDGVAGRNAGGVAGMRRAGAGDPRRHKSGKAEQHGCDRTGSMRHWITSFPLLNAETDGRTEPVVRVNPEMEGEG